MIFDNPTGIISLIQIAEQLEKRKQELEMDVVFCAFNGDISQSHESTYPIKGNYKEVLYISLDSIGVKESESYKLESNIESNKDTQSALYNLYNNFSADFSDTIMLDKKLPIKYNSSSFLSFTTPNLSINQKDLSAIIYDFKEIEQKIDISEIEKISKLISNFIITNTYNGFSEKHV